MSLYRVINIPGPMRLKANPFLDHRPVFRIQDFNIYKSAIVGWLRWACQ